VATGSGSTLDEDGRSGEDGVANNALGSDEFDAGISVNVYPNPAVSGGILNFEH
jgi:hypothetical protein